MVFESAAFRSEEGGSLMAHPSVDIAMPVLNEERSLEGSLSRLVSYLSSECPYDWSITIVDNGSTDETWSLATSFASSNPRTRAIRLDRRGRGGALKAAWSTSTADIVAYMDVDLSTGLESLPALLDPLASGEADVSVGSRLAVGADTQRGVQREAISRIYNLIARGFLRYGVRDAQCGFKAVRSSVAHDLIPRIQDDGWFFDTELLAVAFREGLRIKEVPVTWLEDDDSRVRIVSTAVEDLRGIWRLFRARGAAGADFDRTGADAGRESFARTSLVAHEDERSLDFDSYAPRYEEVVDQSVSFTGRGSAFFAARKVEVLERIVDPDVGPLEGLSLLDVGCGTGTTDRIFMPRVQSLCGVDISEEMLDKARAAVPSATYSWYDGEKLPFPDGTFDVVIAICVLHHVPKSNRYKLVNEMVRVARSKGVVAIFEHNPLNPLTRHAVNSCELDKDAILLSSRETMDMLQDAAHVRAGLTHYLYSPLGGRVGLALDRALHRLPLGGQYAAWVQRPSTGGQ
jgi:ubiquinone/menaquinone biosynthesis C-methylase UbiE/glycosyltransferase involved in cell wall biosynthesis